MSQLSGVWIKLKSSRFDSYCNGMGLPRITATIMGKGEPFASGLAHRLKGADALNPTQPYCFLHLILAIMMGTWYIDAGMDVVSFCEGRSARVYRPQGFLRSPLSR